MKFETAKTIFLVAVGVAILWSAYVGAKEIIGHFALKNKLVEVQMVRLSRSVVSQQVQINTKVLEDRMENLSLTIKQMVKERNQQITDIGKSVAKIKQRVELVKRESNHIYSKGKIIDHEFKKIYAKDVDGKEYPVAWAMFYPNQKSGKRWKTGTYPIEIHERITLAENEERVDSIVEVWIEKDQIKYPIDLENIEWVRREKQSKEWMFNPRLSLGASVSSSESYPNLGVSFFSYGRTNSDMDWRFLDVGIGGNSDTIYFQLVPAEYNIGKVLPLIENIFLGPFMGVDEDSDYCFGGQIAVPF